MKNIEKYKDEIAEVGYDFALLEDNQIVNCEYCPACEGCKFFADGCIVPRMKWLLEESILTDKEKRIIKDITKALEPFNKEITHISKKRWKNGRKEYLLFIYDYAGENFDYVNTPTFNSDEKFKGMEEGKRYSLKELGL